MDMFNSDTDLFQRTHTASMRSKCAALLGNTGPLMIPAYRGICSCIRLAFHEDHLHFESDIRNKTG